MKANDLQEMQRLLRKAKRLDPDCDVNSILANGHVPFSTPEDHRQQRENNNYSHDDHYNSFDEADALRNRKPKARSDSPGPSHSGGRSHRSKAQEASAAADGTDRSRSKSAGRTPTTGVHQNVFTSEEVSHVERIRHCKDYYEILEINKAEFCEILLKKKYRELALKLHPDKCKAPGSTEAFKALGNAYAVLSDSKKRDDYDRYGSEEQQRAAARRQHSDFYDYDVNRGFESEMSPEDIFEMFFGGGFPSGSVHRRRGQFHFRHTEQQQREEPNLFYQLLQILPIIVIIVGGLLVQLFSSDPIYSLNRDSTYHVLRYTRDLRIPYYTKPDFEANYGKRLQQVEQHVEDDYVGHLRNQCYREKSHREGLLWTAKMRGDSELWRRAQEMDLTNCRKLEELYR
uniref:J domain-containing protein n=1 Tax=Globodera rostochiensis TaxID=31243 RepID=A0A914IDA4_GLORO